MYLPEVALEGVGPACATMCRPGVARAADRKKEEEEATARSQCKQKVKTRFVLCFL